MIIEDENQWLGEVEESFEVQKVEDCWNWETESYTDRMES